MSGHAEAHDGSGGASTASPNSCTETVDALVDEALAYQATSFDADEPVDGGDLVQWFAAWRIALREAWRHERHA